MHRDFVPENKIKKAEAVAIRCAHGDTVLYPLAQVSIEVEGRSITVEAAVTDTLPMAVLLGTDIPELTELLGDGSQDVEQALAVYQRERDCGVQPSPLLADGEEDEQKTNAGLDESDSLADEESWMKNFTFDEDLFVKGREKARLPPEVISDLREERLEVAVSPTVEDEEEAIERHVLDISLKN